MLKLDEFLFKESICVRLIRLCLNLYKILLIVWNNSHYIFRNINDDIIYE